MLNQNPLRFVLTFVETCGLTTKRYFSRAFTRKSKNGRKRFGAAGYSAEYEASKWIARLHSDDTSVEDTARFEVWRKLHSQHAHAYEELVATWRQLIASKSVDDTQTHN